MRRRKPSASVRAIWWDVWQSLHMGSLCPSFASPVKWMLCRNSRSTPSWHLPQVTSTFERCTDEAGSALGMIACVVWQSTQVAVTTRPLLSSARPWMLSL